MSGDEISGAGGAHRDPTDIGSGSPSRREATGCVGGAPPIEHAAVTLTDPAVAEVTRGAAAGAVTPVERVLLLDVLRGIALLGIFAVNIALMSMPLMVGFGGPDLATAPRGDQVAWFAMAWLFQFKFISLFSLLFGVGFAVQLARAQRRGGSVTGPYLRRLLVLLGIGLVHGLLVWYGDILTMYAVLGFVLLFVGRLRAQTLFILAAALLLWCALLAGGLGAFQGLMMQQQAARIASAEVSPAEAIAEDDAIDGVGDVEEAPDGVPVADDAPRFAEADTETAQPLPSSAPRGFDAMKEAQFDPTNPIWLEAEHAAYAEGPFLDAFTFRAMTFGFSILVGMFGWSWFVLSMFCLGAALWKSGVLVDASSPWRRRLLFLLPVGLATEFVVAWLKVQEGWEMNVFTGMLEGAHMLGGATLMLGYVGLVMWWVDARPDSAIARAIAAAGRMALTCYLLESLIGTGIMYWWGVGWFGEVDRPTQFAIVGGVWLGLVVFANLWFTVFNYGPAEWVWRTLTYLRPPSARPAAGAAADRSPT